MRKVGGLVPILLLLFLSTRVASAIDNCETYEATGADGKEYCKTCKLPALLSTDKTKCFTCSPGCEKCDPANGTCTQCKANSYLNPSTGACTACSQNCDTCDPTKCTKCKSSFYLGSAGTCDNCSPGCSECKSRTECTSCSVGSLKDNGNKEIICSTEPASSSSTILIVILSIVIFAAMLVACYFVYRQYQSSQDKNKPSGQTGYSPFDAEPGLKPQPDQNSNNNSGKNTGGTSIGGNLNVNPNDPFSDNWQPGYGKQEGADFNPYLKAIRRPGDEAALGTERFAQDFPQYASYQGSGPAPQRRQFEYGYQE